MLLGTGIDGDVDGAAEGVLDGTMEGTTDGSTEGVADGSFDGEEDGTAVGVSVIAMACPALTIGTYAGQFVAFMVAATALVFRGSIQNTLQGLGSACEMDCKPCPLQPFSAILVILVAN
jgi:hypothetical protein